MNFVFVPIYAHAGLALAIGLGACLNATMLFIGLKARGVYHARAGWAAFFLRLVVALVALGLFLAWSAARFDWLALHAQPLLRMAALGGIIVVGAALYFAVLFVCGLRPRDLRRTQEPAENPAPI
jgi:putative peptidoglycan lipid II flippase